MIKRKFRHDINELKEAYNFFNVDLFLIKCEELIKN